jgi:uncharacterized protein (DUF433 family)
MLFYRSQKNWQGFISFLNANSYKLNLYVSLTMPIKNKALLERITLIPGLMGGKPTIRGMRFLVSDVLELLSSGLTEAEILEQHPLLKMKTLKQLFCMLHLS